MQGSLLVFLCSTVEVVPTREGRSRLYPFRPTDEWRSAMRVGSMLLLGVVRLAATRAVDYNVSLNGGMRECCG